MNRAPQMVPSTQHVASHLPLLMQSPAVSSMQVQYPTFNGQHSAWTTPFQDHHPPHPAPRELNSNFQSQVGNFFIPSPTFDPGVQIQSTDIPAPLHQSGTSNLEPVGPDNTLNPAPQSTGPITSTMQAADQPLSAAPVVVTTVLAKSSSRSKKKKKRPRKPPLKPSTFDSELPSMAPQTQLIDTVEKKLQCPDCPRKFSWHFQLQQHTRTHSGERPFVCEQCQQAYKRREHLQRHERAHTGERPYECEDCGKKYRRKTQLARHCLIHTGERPYSCPGCEKTFRRRGHLSRHLKVHGSEASKDAGVTPPDPKPASPSDQPSEEKTSSLKSSSST